MGRCVAETTRRSSCTGRGYDLVLLQRTEQSGLRGPGEIADFVEKNSSALRPPVTARSSRPARPRRRPVCGQRAVPPPASQEARRS